MHDLIQTIKTTLIENPHIDTSIRVRGLFLQPPILFEQKSGLRNISAQYALPPNLSAAEIQDYAEILCITFNHKKITRDFLRDRLAEVCAVIESLNPEITDLHYDRNSPIKIYDTIVGVCSAFTSRDIQFYLDGNTWKKAKSDPAYADKFNTIEQIAPLDWVPAPETLDQMIEQHRLRKEVLTAPQNLRHETPFLT